MKTFKYLAMLAFAAVLLTGCRGQQSVSNSYSYMGFGTTLMNISPSGTITVQAWGTGPNKTVAIEEAKKNALNEVLFKGFPTSNNYMADPLVYEVNARERYAEYFNRFFADGGEYAKFIKEASNTDNSRVEAKTNARDAYGVMLVVDRNALQRQLKQDGVIN